MFRGFLVLTGLTLAVGLGGVAWGFRLGRFYEQLSGL